MRVFALLLLGLAVEAALFAGLVRLGSRGAAPGAPAVLERPAQRPGEAVLLFGGDTALGGDGLAVAAAEADDDAFTAVAPLFAEADLVVLNLEAPIAAVATPHPLWKEYVYRQPPGAAAALAAAGVHVVSLANNHTWDQGAAGLLATLAHLDAAGVASVGAGADEAAARRGLVVNVGGTRVGLLAYCEDKPTWRWWVDQYARPRHPGVAAAGERALAEDLSRLRRQADVVVVSLHAGENYAPPTANAARLAERAIELGADLVVGHHPHVPHPARLYRGRPILASLGNFAFATWGRKELRYGLLARAYLVGGRLARVELVPLHAQNREVRFRPRPVRGAEAARLIATLGPDVRPEGDRGMIEVAP